MKNDFPYSQRDIFQREAMERRVELIESVRALLAHERKNADAERRAAFQPDLSSADGYAASLSPYRSDLRRMLGWPLTEPPPPVAAECELVAEDELGRIYRVSVRVNPFIKSHGLLFLPLAEGKHPLVVAQHGGHGTPELAAGLINQDSSNYNEMIRGLRKKEVAVFAQQLLVWDIGQEPHFDQKLLDREFRQLGGSRAAFDLYQLKASFNWLLTHPEINPDRISMVGLSYGGFYALFFAALEPRIRAVVSSCFVNDRYRYNWEDWVWSGSARRFLDSEVARMICPRPLFLETGQNDELFEPSGFKETSAEVMETYCLLGLEARCRARIHSGGHEYDPDGEAQNFLMNFL